MAKKKLSPRAERRVAARVAGKLSAARERLAGLEPGGDPSRPLPLESASQVEPHALSLACLWCGAAYRLDEHAAVPVGGEMLRVARLQCAQCGARREVWFRLAPPRPN
ncbi:MAG TPA: hypothetical protein VHV30_15385 [Polyangiaceae bacterium]|nr:hypothetical protein [Polyangiaceae bacterium]